MPCGPAVAFQGPRHLCVQRSGCGPRGADPVNPPPGMRGISQGPRHLCPLVRGGLAPWDRGENISGPLAPVSSPSRPLRGCVSGPSAPALPAGCGAGLLGGAGEGVSGPSAPAPSPLEAWGGACQGFRHLRYPPLTQFPGGRPPPCATALVGVRGEGDGGLGVLCCVGLHGHPRAREGEMPETSGASQVHLRLSIEVLLRQLRNLERSRPPAAPTLVGPFRAVVATTVSGPRGRGTSSAAILVMAGLLAGITSQLAFEGGVSGTSLNKAFGEAGTPPCPPSPHVRGRLGPPFLPRVAWTGASGGPGPRWSTPRVASPGCRHPPWTP